MPNRFSRTGFIRINPSSAPLNPPGAAPTLTTIYDEVATIQTSAATSPSDSLSKEPLPPKQKARRRKRSIPFAAKAAKEGIEGTAKEKRRTQIIADSLDLGGDLQVDGENGGSRVVGEGDATLVERKTVATESGFGSLP